MTARAYPRKRIEPRKRWILVPIILMFGGLAITSVPYMQFIGIVVSLAGAFSFFLVGMLIAEMWTSSRSLKKITETRDNQGVAENIAFEEYDPFKDLLSDDKTEK